MKPSRATAKVPTKQQIGSLDKQKKHHSKPKASKQKQKKRVGNKQPQTHHDQVHHRDPSAAQAKDLTPLYLHKTAVGTVSIPHELHKGIHTVLKGVPRDALKKEGTALSDMLRARTTSRKTITTVHFGNNSTSLANQKVEKISTDVIPPISYTEGKSLAYTAHRMPGVFACTYRVLNEVRLKLPEYTPKSMLDFGSGPGTTVWAASRVWTNTIKDILAVEPSSAMIDVAQKMFTQDQTMQSVNTQWRRFLFAANEGQTFDLVTAGYVMSELKDNQERKQFAKNLWDATEPGGTLVIIEPGTPIGFEIIKMLRTVILSEPLPSNLEAQIVGPCPHVFACPMQGKSWCHFIQRATRIPLTLGAKLGASQNWEDEKYSYISFHKKIKEAETKPNTAYQEEGEVVSVGKTAVLDNAVTDTKWSRIISPPLKRGGHIILDLCTHEGQITRETVSKSLGDGIYRAARKSSWGDAFNRDARIDAEEQRATRRLIIKRNVAVKKALANKQHQIQTQEQTKHKKVEQTDSQYQISTTEMERTQQAQLQRTMEQRMNQSIKKLPTETLAKMLEQAFPTKGLEKTRQVGTKPKVGKKKK